MTTNTNEEMSMLEVAEQLIQRKIKPQKFDKIAKEVCEIMGISDEEFKENIAQFYSDLTLSGKFVTVGEDKWDLKSRQKYEVANYDTYDIEFDDEDDTLDTLDENGFAKIADEDEKKPTKSDDTEENDDSYEDGQDENNNEDDYSDESDAEVSKKESTELEGLSIYNEEDME